MEGTYVGRLSKSNIRMNQEKHDAKNVIPFVGNSINAKLFVIILFQPIYSILVIILLFYGWDLSTILKYTKVFLHSSCEKIELGIHLPCK